MEIKICQKEGCENPTRNDSCLYCRKCYDDYMRKMRRDNPSPSLVLFTVWEDEKDHPLLAEAPVIKVGVLCFWIARKNEGFAYRTRIRRDEEWYSFTPGEAVRGYLLEKRREIEIFKRQIEQAEILLEGIKE